MTTVNAAAADLLTHLETSGLPPEEGIESLAMALVCLVKAMHGPECMESAFDDLVWRMRVALNDQGGVRGAALVLQIPRPN